MRKGQQESFLFTNTKGITYEIVFRKPRKDAYGESTFGLCVDPSEAKGDYIPKIYINPYLTKKSELNTCVHEIAHAFFWDKSETDVSRFADVCSNFLYQNGWRLEKRKFQAPPRKRRKPFDKKEKEKGDENDK
jgi:Zn-dependent peptidase ImmA (M78 family)